MEICVMTRRQLFTVIFLLIFLSLLWHLVRILEPFFPPITWAIILATVTYPIYTRLRRGVGGRADLAAAFMTAGLLLTAVLPAIYGIILAAQQGVEAYDQVSAWLKAGRIQDLNALMGEIPGVGPLIQRWVGESFVARSESIQTSLLEGGKVVSSFLISQSVDFAMNALMLATDFIVMIFTLFFVFRDGEYAFGRLRRAIPLEAKHKTKIFTRLQSTVHAVVRGNFADGSGPRHRFGSSLFSPWAAVCDVFGLPIRHSVVSSDRRNRPGLDPSLALSVVQRVSHQGHHTCCCGRRNRGLDGQFIAANFRRC
jgi:predicted PurR-regulated permease PerM